jgi:cytochrome c-type biogenesis protein CcmF
MTVRNKRRYGGFIIHTGVEVLFVGIAASSFYQLEKDVTVKPNETFSARSYEMKFLGLNFQQDAHKEVMSARLAVFKNGKSVGFLVPERHFYRSSDQPTTEVALRSFWNEDLYIILAGWDDQGTATFKTYVNPFISWIWRGGLIMFLGGLIVLMPDYKTRTAVSHVREPLAAEETT